MYGAYASGGNTVAEWGPNSIPNPVPAEVRNCIQPGDDPPPVQLYSADPGNGQPHIPWISVDYLGNLYIYGVPVGSGVPLPGTQVVTPSGDTSGATDVTNIAAAFTSLGGATGTGTVYLTPGGTYYINGTGITQPPYINVNGFRSVINCVGSGTGTYWLIKNTANPSSYTRLSGGVSGLIIDGTSAGSSAIGFQRQDTNGTQDIVAVRNFTGATATGVQIANNLFSLNQMQGYIRIENCTQGLVFNALGSQTAIEHINVNWSIQSGSGQNPITLTNSVGIQGSSFTAAVSSDPAGGPVFTFGSGCLFTDTIFQFKGEQTSASSSSITMSFPATGLAGLNRCSGSIFFSSNITGSNIGSAAAPRMQYWGQLNGDASLFNLPSNFVSGTTYTNQGGPCLVAISGGTVTAITINGVALTGLTSGSFFIPPGGTYEFTYSGSPSVTFTNCVP